MKKPTRSTVIILTFTLSLVLFYFIYNVKTQKEIPLPNDLPGKFIQTTHGRTYYELLGNPSDPTVVFIAGFAVASYVWDKNYYSIAQSGFRVLRYDHYGRGYSEKPAAHYSQDLFDSQLYELLNKLQITNPVHIIGISMGGAIAVIFTDRHPQLVKSLCLISPTGFPIKESMIAKLVKLPLVGEGIMHTLGNRTLLKRNPNNFYQPEKFPEIQAKLALQLQEKGFKRALLSTLRHMPFNNIPNIYNRVGKLKKRTLVLWGVHDAVVPFENHVLVQKSIPQSAFYPIQQSGHNSVYETPKQINTFILDFLMH